MPLQQELIAMCHLEKYTLTCIFNRWIYIFVPFHLIIFKLLTKTLYHNRVK